MSCTDTTTEQEGCLSESLRQELIIMISNFTEIGVPEDVAKAMDENGWEEPTPIQKESIPMGLEGIDLFGRGSRHLKRTV